MPRRLRTLLNRLLKGDRESTSVTYPADSIKGRINPANIDQSTSLLLTLLPPEIRQKIYHEALGGSLLHILRLPDWPGWHGRRLAHARCLRPPVAERSTYIHDCWGEHCYDRDGQWDGKFIQHCRNGPPYQSSQLLSLPLTCRQMYG